MYLACFVSSAKLQQTFRSELSHWTLQLISSTKRHFLLVSIVTVEVFLVIFVKIVFVLSDAKL